jgi:hypothetical protein
MVLLSGIEYAQVFMFVYICIAIRDLFIKREKIWIGFLSDYVVLFFVFNDLMWDAVFRFVVIGVIVAIIFFENVSKYWINVSIISLVDFKMWETFVKVSGFQSKTVEGDNYTKYILLITTLSSRSLFIIPLTGSS